MERRRVSKGWAWPQTGVRPRVPAPAPSAPDTQQPWDPVLPSRSPGLARSGAHRERVWSPRRGLLQNKVGRLRPEKQLAPQNPPEGLWAQAGLRPRVSRHPLTRRPLLRRAGRSAWTRASPNRSDLHSCPRAADRPTAQQREASRGTAVSSRDRATCQLPRPASPNPRPRPHTQLHDGYTQATSGPERSPFDLNELAGGESKPKASSAKAFGEFLPR